MQHVGADQRKRKRILNDVEIRDLWRGLEQANVPEVYRRCVRALLFSGQRRDEIAKAS